MKILKSKLGLFSLLIVMAASAFLISCEQEEIINPPENYQESMETPKDAEKMLSEIEDLNEANLLTFKTPKNLTIDEAIQWVNSLSEKELKNYLN